MSSIVFWLSRARAATRRSPKDLIVRAVSELNGELERFRVAKRSAAFDVPALLRATGASSVDMLWDRLASRPFAVATREIDGALLERISPGETARIRAAAAKVLERKVDLLGSGPVELGTPIDWHVDFKTGARWALGYGRRIEYSQLAKSSDVKVPWELSRLQWVIPAGQAYLLTGEAAYADATRAILEEWIAANPYGWSVNWSVTMEVALRIVTWTWLFHVFDASPAWSDPGFRSRFLRALYLHCEYTERNVERSAVNGNHYTANAVGLAVGGLFFATGHEAKRWADGGWSMLEAELPRQVFPDGVDFEASTAYHRLVTELFFLPALYRTRLGLAVDPQYRDRLVAMARFAVAYCRPDGSSPLVGDADDGRVLPLGTQPLGDHRYIGGLIGVLWDVGELRESFSGPRSEVAWTLGPAAAAKLNAALPEITSHAFPDGGFYVMRGHDDHVFIDCGPVGFSGRGGHGHNDCLSFEAWLNRELVVTDSGAYVYTADYRARNRFRATAMHNTPQVDGEEQNRFVRPEYLWLLQNDARPSVSVWRPGEVDLFRGGHDGYRRLARPVILDRTIVLDRSRHFLVVLDKFIGSGDHSILVPFHLAIGAAVLTERPGEIRIRVGAQEFALSWTDATNWSVQTRTAEVSPSYGFTHPSTAVAFARHGALCPLLITLAPADGTDHVAYARALLAREK